MDEHRQEQAGAYALGVLPEDERAEFEQALARDPELKRLVREFTDAIGETARSLPKVAPSAGLKQRIMDRVAETQPPRARNVVPFPLWIPWTVAACLAVGFVLHYTSTTRHIKNQEKQIASVEAHRMLDQIQSAEKIESLEKELLAARGAADLAKLQVARLTSELQPRVQAVSFWNNTTKQGVLVVENLALPPPGKTYQLWVIDPATRSPVDAGIFTTAPDGTGRIIFSPKANVDTAAAIAVSLEDAGGVAVPTQVVMVGENTTL